MEKDMINVLWIDDDPTEDFQVQAYEEYDIHITVSLTVNEGFKKLDNPEIKYDAIILDANGVIEDIEKEDPDMSALSNALLRIANKIDIPWFVYSGTGYEGENYITNLVKGASRNYDDKLWYKKPKERNELFQKINDVVKNTELYKIKSKYSQLFEFHPRQKVLYDIICYFKNNVSTDPNIFNMIRKELEWIMCFCQVFGKNITFDGTNLSQCSTDLGRMRDVPIHIRRSLHSSVVITNEGSHRASIDNETREGNVPYLTNSTIFEYLNILYWLSSLKMDKERRKEYIEKANTMYETLLDPKEFIGHESRVLNGGQEVYLQLPSNYKCKISKDYNNIIGKKVKIISIIKNEGADKKNYLFIAKEIEEIND